MERNLFEVATRAKYRYPYNGMISTEDLWDLSIERLNEVYKRLAKEKNNGEEDSLLTSAPKDTALLDKIEIVKAIFGYKLEMTAKAEKAAETKRKNQRIMELIAEKQDEKLKSLSVEELEKMIAE